MANCCNPTRNLREKTNISLSRTESAAAARKDTTPPIDGQKSHVDVSGNAYSEHDSSPPLGKDDASADQVATSFGDMSISVAVQNSPIQIDLEQHSKFLMDFKFEHFRFRRTNRIGADHQLNTL